MNTRSFSFAIVAVFFCCSAFGEVSDASSALQKLADSLAGAIKENGKKKVAVVDFTDLQEATSELGKYVAEELTVNLVLAKQGFSVMDRANLNKILAEHKLTSKGLVDPENAKKLGMFAGVDALVLGKYVQKGSSSVSLTAKIIATDTAEVVGAGRAEFKIDESVQKLLATAVKAEAPSDNDGQRAAKPASKPFGDLEVKSAAVKYLGSDGLGLYMYTRLTFVITNTSEMKTYGVALNHDVYRLYLSNNRGDDFELTELRGISTMREESPGSFDGKFTDIAPKSSIIMVCEGQKRGDGKAGDYRPYHFQSSVVFGEEDQGRYSNVRKYNLEFGVK